MQQGFTGVMRRFAVAGSNWGAVTSQRRSAANPYMEAHQESELSCFPPRAQPRVLYTGKAKYDVAYMLQREPIVTPEVCAGFFQQPPKAYCPPAQPNPTTQPYCAVQVHPMIADFEEAVEEVHKAYPRTQDGSNISRVLKKNLPDAYRTLTNNQQTPYWREPKFVQQELTALRTLKVCKYHTDKTSTTPPLSRRSASASPPLTSRTRRRAPRCSGGCRNVSFSSSKKMECGSSPASRGNRYMPHIIVLAAADVLFLLLLFLHSILVTRNN